MRVCSPLSNSPLTSIFDIPSLDNKAQSYWAICEDDLTTEKLKGSIQDFEVSPPRCSLNGTLRQALSAHASGGQGTRGNKDRTVVQREQWADTNTVGPLSRMSSEMLFEMCFFTLLQAQGPRIGACSKRTMGSKNLV